jgi:hypothetical protein
MPHTYWFIYRRDFEWHWLHIGRRINRLCMYITTTCRTMPNLVVLHSLVSESASASRTEDPGFESPPGCKVFRSLYTAVPLSKLNMHCSVYLRKNKCFKKVCYKTLVFGGSQPIFAALVTALASSSYLPCCCMFRRTNSIRESYLCTICDLWNIFYHTTFFEQWQKSKPIVKLSPFSFIWHHHDSLCHGLVEVGRAWA